MANKNTSLLNFANMGGKKEKGADPEVKSIAETSINQFYKPAKKIEKKQVSIYLDADVIEAFNEFGKAEGKGAKSDIVNNFLKQVFNIRQGEN